MFSTVITGLFVFSALALSASGGSGDALFAGASEAVSLCIELAGGICFWSAVMELMEQSGLSTLLGKGLRPVLGKIFPRSCADEGLLSALTENVSANILGLGNAATPAGIRAARGMAAMGKSGADELCMLVVLNTASIQLLPSTIAALRAAQGAQAAFDIIPAVWISSAVSLAVGLGAASLFRRLWP